MAQDRFRRRDAQSSLRRSTRRQFLVGKSAVDALEDLADAMSDAVEPQVAPSVRRTPSASSFVMQFTRAAMACEFTVYLNAGQYERGAQSALAALDLVERLEDQLTVYRDHSEVMEVNRQAAQWPTVVEAGLFDLLSQARQLSADTQGAFDITAGPLSRVWGFLRRQGRLPSESELQQALACVGSHHVVLDTPSQSVRFLHPGVEINLGGIGKGYALDRCAAQLVGDGLEDFIIHGGRSSVLARGQRAGSDRAAWQVDVRHPLRPSQLIARVNLRNGALGTSGSAMQSYHVAGRRLGHILDPRTGQPVEGMLSVTALAPKASWADALGTAFYVLGPEGTQAYCDQHPEIGALLIRPGERAGDVLVDAINLADDQLEWTEGIGPGT